MAKVAPGDLARFMAGGWQTYAAVLIFGSDEGLVRETADRLVAAAAGPDPDPLNIVVLDGETVASDPPRLVDEVQTVSMFGGNRAIHLRNAGKAPLLAVEAATGHRAENTFIVMEAGELKAGTGLRGYTEKARTVATIACYPDTQRNLGQLIDEVAQEHGLTVTREARALLQTSLGADRALSRSELDKLALYATGTTSITIDMVQDIVADAARQDTSVLIDRAFSGDYRGVEPEANRLFASGIHPSAVLSQAITLAFTLRKASRSSLDEAARSHRLHFSRLPLLERAMSRWTERQLAQALTILADAMRQTRIVAVLAEPITIRALWSVARLAQPRTIAED